MRKRFDLIPDTLRLLDETRADIQYALRMLRQAPAFTAVAILSLALGIGANTAIFSLMEAALWKPIPVNDPAQLRLFSWVSGPKTIVNSSWGSFGKTPAGGYTSTSFSYPVFEELQRHNTTLHDLFAFKPLGRITALVDGKVELVRATLVSGSFYSGLGVSAAAGRTILPSDDTGRSSGAVAMISYGYWNRRFGRDGAVIGKQINLNQIPVTVVGVTSPGFTGVEPGQSPDVYLPIKMQPIVAPYPYSKAASLMQDTELWWVLIMGRLNPGISEAKARAELDLVMLQAVRATMPKKLNRDLPSLRFITGSRGLDDLRQQFGKPLFVLMASVGLVLLIACANLANLLLARATAREREMGVRIALGAGNARITRQLLTEGLVLCLLGGAAGVLLGYWTRNGIPRLMASPWGAGPFEGEFDAKVFAASIAVSLLTGILFSIAPAWHLKRADVNTALKGGAQASTILPKLFAAKSLVVFQISLSVLLLVGAGLFLRTLSNLQSAALGFRPERILLFNIDPPRTRYAGESRVSLFARLEAGLAAIPGLQSSTLSSTALVANSSSTTNANPTGRKDDRGSNYTAWVNDVGNRFFETMGIPILYGRSINARDRLGSEPIAVVNRAFVRHFYPNETPLGKTFRSNDVTYQIAGVCGDARYNRIRGEIPPTFYRAYFQLNDEQSDMTFELKTSASESSVIAAAGAVVHSIDQDLPLIDIRTQTEQIDATLSHERLFAVLASGFGLLALAVACVGIYGVMAYGVARRTREIGLRIALGATGRKVLGMILYEAAALASIGISVGIISAAGLARFIESMLFGVKPVDPMTLVVSICVMATVALLATWWPARKASRIDPMTALRHD